MASALSHPRTLDALKPHKPYTQTWYIELCTCSARVTTNAVVDYDVHVNVEPFALAVVVVVVVVIELCGGGDDVLVPLLEMPSTRVEALIPCAVAVAMMLMMLSVGSSTSARIGLGGGFRKGGGEYESKSPHGMMMFSGNGFWL